MVQEYFIRLAVGKNIFQAVNFGRMYYNNDLIVLTYYNRDILVEMLLYFVVHYRCELYHK